MKNYTNKPNDPTSIFDSEMFWIAHRSILASIWMKYDWFKLERTEFTAKWMQDLLRTRNPNRKMVVLPIVKRIWSDMDTHEKYETLIRIIKDKHFADSVNLLMDLNEIIECDFLATCIEKSYRVCTGKKWDIDRIWESVNKQ